MSTNEIYCLACSISLVVLSSVSTKRISKKKKQESKKEKSVCGLRWFLVVPRELKMMPTFRPSVIRPICFAKVLSVLPSSQRLSSRRPANTPTEEAKREGKVPTTPQHSTRATPQQTCLFHLPYRSKISKKQIKKTQLIMGSSERQEEDDQYNEGGTATGSEDTVNNNVKVYVRLRPMDKLELMRRSKDCIELDDVNPKIVTVDAPHQGVRDFSFDMVFDEYASQEEVYKEVFAGIPEKLLEGINCTVFAYGQTGTGKTHTMLGAGQGTELVVRARGGVGGSEGIDNSGDVSTMDSSDKSNNSRSGGSHNGTNGSKSNKNQDHIVGIDPGITEGMIPRVVANLFELLLLPGRMKATVVSDGDDDNNNLNYDFYKDHIEYTIRCSFVEIYLERIRDLLQPSQTGIRIGPDETSGNMCVLGATELICVDPEDIYALIARGTAFRTQSSTIENSDSSRSHAIVTIRLEQVNKQTGRYRSSKLQLLDLAGSEFSQRRDIRSTDSTSAIAKEARMINQSLACLSGMVRSTLIEQGKLVQPPSKSTTTKTKTTKTTNSRTTTNSSSTNTTTTSLSATQYAQSTNLAKLLRPCLGGNSFTTVIVTASSASHNIGHTMASLKFGDAVQRITNTPTPTVARTVSDYIRCWTMEQRRNDNLTVLIQSLVKEFASLRNKVSIRNPRIWMIVEEVAKAMKNIPDDEVELVVQVTSKKKGGTSSSSRSSNNKKQSLLVGKEQSDDDEKDQRIIQLEKELEKQKLECERLKAANKDLLSERTEIKSTMEFLSKDNLTLKQIIKDCQSENRLLTTRKSAVEHNLRTSQFRENEATTFLRQFRSFYVRLLKNKAAQGSGDTRQITEDLHRKFPGVPELADLINIDSLMSKSGLIEQSEVGEDTNNTEYFPTKAALSRSATEAELAEKKEQELLAKLGQSSLSSDKMKESGLLSVVHRIETAQFVAHRQRLLKTPAGIASMKKEKELENELVELSKKCINLQNSLEAERAMVEALSGRQGALSKMKSAQEMNLLQQELERKTNDLQAIIWTMNELHLVNKAVDEKAQNREQHITHLEDLLVDYQAGSGKLVIETQAAEQKLKEEAVYLRKQLEGLTVQLWQLGDPTNTEERPMPCRLIVPFQCIPEEEEEEEPLDELQLSVGSLGDELDAPSFREFVRMVTSSTTQQREDAPAG